jgi:SAM-dependent methyltransferase
MRQHYLGAELELFSTATNWKSYFASMISPFVAGRVLEVGAGIGANISYLSNAAVTEWTSLEPDPELGAQIREAVKRGKLPACSRVVIGNLDSIEMSSCFDTILYIDVLEHIGEDAVELVRAAEHLTRGGHLIVLAPAHQFLFSAFDEAVGHYRRYNRKSLAALVPPGCTLRSCRMLDAVGFFASLANVALLRSAVPSKGQIKLWDSCMVPLSRVADRVMGHRFGKTVIAVWRADAVTGRF